MIDVQFVALEKLNTMECSIWSAASAVIQLQDVLPDKDIQIPREGILTNKFKEKNLQWKHYLMKILKTR